MAQRASSKKVANGLVAVSSAAVLTIYAAGYARTRSAADLIEARTTERIPPVHLPQPESPRPEQKETAPAAPEVAKSPVPALENPAVTETSKAEPPPVAALPAISAPIAPIIPQVAEPEKPSPVPEPAPPVPSWKDGTYTGWGTSRHGDIQASVVVEGGRITSATIAQCLTRYSCSVIEKLPPQVAQRQSPEVDFVSGATQSTNAFYYAVVDALGKAK